MLHQDNGVTQEREVGRGSPVRERSRGAPEDGEEQHRLTVHARPRGQSVQMEQGRGSRENFFRKLNLINT